MSHLLVSTCSSDQSLLPWSEVHLEELGGLGAWSGPDSSLRHRNSLELSRSLHCDGSTRMHPF